MIEPMKQVSVICLAKDREATVDRLGDLGTVHVVAVNTPSSPKVDELSEELSRAEQALLLLEGADADEPIAPGDTAMNASEVVEKVLKTEGLIECEDEAQVDFLQFHEELVHWGSFSKELLKELQDKGVTIRLGCALAKRLPDPPEGWTLHVVNTVGKEAYFVLVSESEQELPEDWDVLPVPHMTNLDEIASALEKSRKHQMRLRCELAGLKPFESKVSEYIEQVRSEMAFAEAHAGMGEAEKLAYLTGYIPACNTDQLLRAASEQGWGVRLDDPTKEDEKVPTLLRLPKALKLSRTIFDFIGILPGYREVDVSSSMLIFLTIFFGMIIGDGGYGAVFLAIALFFRNRVQSDSGRRALKLFGVLSVTTLVWGFLTGNFFAVPTEKLPGFMQGIDPLMKVEDGVRQSDNQVIQWLCFFIAAVHLSLARVWNAILAFLHEKRLAAMGQVGWGLFLWANFFMAVDLIVYKGSFPEFGKWLYILGAVLILGCGVDWKDVGGIMNVPFNFINSFVDVLSYIRLFAVGLSSFYIAKSFNDMGMMVYDLSPILAPATVLIILFGHLLNVALGFMGVLVHGVRLNTLEFSNHMGLEWTGRPYNPLKKTPSSTLSTQSTSS
jgi:V/A-type H+-transporting ATPase subunit I